MNLVGCASTPDSTVKAETLQFCNSNEFVFPTLLDVDAEIAHLYGITTTPTTVVIGPDGVVDTTIVTHGHGGEGEGFAEMIERRKRELLPSS